MNKGPTLQIIGPMTFDTKLIDENLETIIVDGGLNHNLKLKKKVISIGDNDSNTTSASPSKVLNPNKDFSDFHGALTLAKNHHKVVLYGFLNGRKDHEFANILEAVGLLPKNCEMSFEDRIIIFNKSEFCLNHIGVFSLFCFEECQISISGKVKYPLENQPLKARSSHGLSNESSGLIQINNMSKKNIILFLN